jgi:hypothetical protein
MLYISLTDHHLKVLYSFMHFSFIIACHLSNKGKKFATLEGPADGGKRLSDCITDRIIVDRDEAQMVFSHDIPAVQGRDRTHHQGKSKSCHEALISQSTVSTFSIISFW